MAWAIKSSESFDRVNGALGGSTLDNAGGGSESGNTWNPVSGDWFVDDSMCFNEDADTVVVVGSTAAVNKQRVTATYLGSISNETGVIGRWAAGTGGNGNLYLTYVNASAVIQLYRYTEGSGFTQLGSNGGSLSTGDTWSVESVDDQISALLNSSATVGPITDATYATGKPGIYGGAITKFRDDFVHETDEGAPPAPASSPMLHGMAAPWR